MDSRYVIFKKKTSFGKSYALGLERDKDLRWYEFAIPEMAQGPLLVNDPNITRLFSSNDHENHDLHWLDYKGGTTFEYTKMGNIIAPKQIGYELFDSGSYKFGEQEPLFDELFFKGDKLTGRWFLRKMPNVFEKTLFASKEITLLWKPTKQMNDKGVLEETICPCIMENALSKNSEMKTFEVHAKFESDLLINEATHEVSGIAAAEGTWIDLFGNTFTYTASFMDQLLIRLKENLPFLTIDKDHNSEDRGLVDTVSMVQKPIKHIVAKGKYNGSIDDVRGFSLEMTLKSVWSDDFQSWIPFDANPERLSLVGSPACKICWINQVN